MEETICNKELIQLNLYKFWMMGKSRNFQRYNFSIKLLDLTINPKLTISSIQLAREKPFNKIICRIQLN